MRLRPVPGFNHTAGRTVSRSSIIIFDLLDLGYSCRSFAFAFCIYHTDYINTGICVRKVVNHCWISYFFENGSKLVDKSLSHLIIMNNISFLFTCDLGKGIRFFSSFLVNNSELLFSRLTNCSKIGLY